MLVKCWQLGNTTVRSALRLRDGLIAYGESDVQGAIRRHEGDVAFRRLLGEAGLVSLGDDATNSVGRKWRSAMGKLGFIYPEVPEGSGAPQEALGPLDCITPAGRRLIQAETMPAIYDAFLRAMAVPLHSTHDGRRYSPLRWTLAVLLTLEEHGAGEGYLTFEEFAVFVQTTNPIADRKQVASDVLDSRANRTRFSSARDFKRALLDEGEKRGSCKRQTLRDYADENIRYLKATGLIQSKGRGIRLVEEKRYIARTLSEAELFDDTPLTYMKLQCEGADLPTDDLMVANAALDSIAGAARASGVLDRELSIDRSSVADVNAARYKLEELIAQKKEEAYALRQRSEVNEISCYLEMLAAGEKRRRISDDEYLSIPSDERPAYLEWALWRSVLAIDSLENAPYDVRRFKIDSDFLPVCTAPGGGADLVAEFPECVVAVEVTMSCGSRQEAMEGEPVRRHVADLVEEHEKPVVGLFVAGRVNLNTIETFRHGLWYTADEQLRRLSIVPLSLRQFAEVFQGLFCGAESPSIRLVKLLEECSDLKQGRDALEWRAEIDRRLAEWRSAAGAA